MSRSEEPDITSESVTKLRDRYARVVQTLRAAHSKSMVKRLEAQSNSTLDEALLIVAVCDSWLRGLDTATKLKKAVEDWQNEARYS